MIFREPTHELLDSCFQFSSGHVAKDALGCGPDPVLSGTGDGPKGTPPPLFDGWSFDWASDTETATAAWAAAAADSDSGSGSGSGSNLESDSNLDDPTGDHEPEPHVYAFRSDEDFVALYGDIQREALVDPYHAGHCVFAHMAMRGLVFLDPLLCLRLLRAKSRIMTRGAALYASSLAPHVTANTLFHPGEVTFRPIDLPGWTGALITMPPPTQPSGVHFAAALLPLGIPDHLAPSMVEYITLEESVELHPNTTTTLGRRLPDQTYASLGPGPAVTPTAFLEAVQSILLAPRPNPT